MSTGKKLKFEVAYASAEDAEYPASELAFHSPSTRGWQSPRFAEFPQELGIRFAAGRVEVTQVQLLSHQTKIASKVELFVGSGRDYFSCSWRRLGHFSLDSNTRSNYKARELKSVHITAEGQFMKFLLHRPHANPHNVFNQVGVIAINCLGQALGPAAGMSGYAEPEAMAHRRAEHDLATDMSMDPATAATLREVLKRKWEAVEREDYELAKHLKAVESSLKAVGGKMAELESRKRAAVAAEDYSTASAIKGEMDAVRAGIQRQMTAIASGNYAAALAPAPAPAQQHGYGAPAPAPMPWTQQSAPAAGPRMAMHTQPDAAMPSPGGGANVFGSGAATGGPPFGQAPFRAAQFNPQHSPEGKAVDDFETLSPAGGRRTPAEGKDIVASGAMERGHTPPRGAPTLPPGFGAADADELQRPDSRAIRPQSANALERALQAEEAGVGAGFGASRTGGAAAVSQAGPSDVPPGAASAGAAAASAPEGARADASQLAGVEGVDELPAPGPIKTADRQAADELSPVLGEYVVRCLFSPVWNLREVALQKMQLDIPSYDAAPGAVLTAVMSAITRVAKSDRIAQVFISSTQLLPVLLDTVGGKVPKDVLLRELDPLVHALVEKLGDNAARNRDAAVDALLEIATKPGVGPSFVARQLTRPLSKKQANVWRPLATRLLVLAMLVGDQNLLTAPGNDLSIRDLFQFSIKYNAHTHANGEMREAAKLLACEMAKVDRATVEDNLDHLRPKQRQEYLAAFDAPDAEAGEA